MLAEDYFPRRPFPEIRVKTTRKYTKVGSLCQAEFCIPCNSDTADGGKEGEKAAGGSPGLVCQSFLERQGRRIMWAGISGDEGNSFPGSVELREIGACEATQERSLLEVRVAEHDSVRERGFDEGDGF